MPARPARSRPDRRVPSRTLALPGTRAHCDRDRGICGPVRQPHPGESRTVGADAPVRDKGLADLVSADKHAALLLGERTSETTFVVPPAARGQLKLALIRIGYPVDDRAGYAAGERFPITLRAETRSGQKVFTARPYQHEAARAFHPGGSERGGSGVIVLPCGAGKTIVGMLCMDLLQTSTLVLTTCVTAVRQWIAELIDKTDIDPSMVGEYHRAEEGGPADYGGHLPDAHAPGAERRRQRRGGHG